MILRKAVITDTPFIWEILQQAIEQRRQDGSQQWQDGYPNLQTVGHDIENEYAYVVLENEVILGYAAIIFGVEPAYETIEGKWLTNADYAAVHRVATANIAKGRGMATWLFKEIQNVCLSQNVHSIKVDTNFDNAQMLRILEKLDYTYCGEVYFRGAARRAYEKTF